MNYPYIIINNKEEFNIVKNIAIANGFEVSDNYSEQYLPAGYVSYFHETTSHDRFSYTAGSLASIQNCGICDLITIDKLILKYQKSNYEDIMQLLEKLEQKL